MSHQPSTADQVKANASSAYETVANTVAPSSENAGDYDSNKDADNFAKDAHGNTFKKGDFKDKLNEAANNGLKQKEPEESYIDKALSYIPGVNSSKASNSQAEPQQEINPGQPPQRPEHDVQVEQFLRKQYHSTAGQGMPDPGDK